ncbi:MAG TPA: hypothetical protein PKI32_05490, partial [Opitutales bacterium]|nr:hypothetical protein [Opitutales bacterium]
IGITPKDEGGHFDGVKIVIEGRDDKGKNPFTERINNGVADFERFLRPIIDKKSSTLFKRLRRPFKA